jgi:hypothetical protein
MLTNKQIDALKAGPELDLLVYQTFYEGKEAKIDAQHGLVINTYSILGWIEGPKYSTSLDACSLMEKRLAELDLSDEYAYHLIGMLHLKHPTTNDSFFKVAIANPAIRCQAALKATNGHL